MFGNDDGHHDHNGFSVGQLLVGLYLWREMEAGRLSPGDIFKTLFVIAAVIGGGFLLLLVIAGASVAPYGGSVGAGYPYIPATNAPVYLPAWTPKPVWTAVPTFSPAPPPTPIPGIGTRVAAGGEWTVTVDKVQRWKPSWYRQPGWQLITVYVTVRMAADDNCVWGDMFSVTAPGGTDYQGWLDQTLREPSIFECADYHRPTTAKGWVTFEVRNEDAKGLLMTACLPEMFSCDDPAVIRIT